jgi:NADH:ubiquinone oxidoreductase subunit 2 (subunit N)
VLTTVVSAGYYLYVIVVMFMKPPPTSTEPLPPTPPLTRLVLAVSVVGILILGVYPNWVQNVASKGAPRRLPPASLSISPANDQLSR